MISPRTTIPPARAFAVYGVDAVLNLVAVFRAAARRRPFVDEQTLQTSPLHLRELSSSIVAYRALRTKENVVYAQLSAGECGAGALGELSETLKLVECVASLRGSRLQSWIAERARSRHAVLADRVLEPVAAESRSHAAANGRLLPASVLISTTSTREVPKLQEKLAHAEKALMQRMQKLAKGTTVLNFSGDDLVGLSNSMCDGWRKGRSGNDFKIPVDRAAFEGIMSFAHRRSTREKVFDAYYRMFGPEDDEAALDVLRARQKLAHVMGYSCWADFELASLTVGNIKQCDMLLDTCYKRWLPFVQSMLKGMRSYAERAQAAYGPERSGGAAMDQVDELYVIAADRGEAHDWKLSESLRATKAVKRALSLAADVFQVQFEAVDLSTVDQGWSSKVQAYTVQSGSGFLGFLYLDLYERWYHTVLGSRVEQAKAIPISRGHVFLAMNFQQNSYGAQQTMSYAEVACFVHEIGHAIHYLCSPHSPAEYCHMPLDIQETPSVLAEMIAYDPSAVSQISGSTDSKQIKSTIGHRDVFFFLHLLQNVAALHALHSETFDAQASTPADLRDVLRGETQRFSPFSVRESFHPFGRMTGIHLAQSMNQIAYLFAYGKAEGYLAGARSKSSRAFPPPCTRACQEVLSCRFPPHVLNVAAAHHSVETVPRHPFAKDASRLPSNILNGITWRASAAR